MAQTTQIVPKFSFPYVETVINDYTLETNKNESNVTENPVIRYIFPFISSKGIDNKFIRKRTRANIVASYGESNYKKYGQPLMQTLHIAENPNAEIWCMRVMPENASYSHNIISVFYKADTEGDPSTRKFRIKFVQKQATTDTHVLSDNDLATLASTLDGEGTNGVYTDAEGYVQIPGVITMRSAGRGKYGDNYRVRLAQDVYYEKDYGIKFYSFEVLSAEKGLKKEATYVGSLVTSNKYDTTTLINDVLDDAEDGLVPVFIKVDEDGVEDVYNAYVDWVTSLATELQTELDTKVATYSIPEGMIEGVIPVTDEYADKVAEIRNIMSMINQATSTPDLDQFDMIFGRNVATTTVNPFIAYPTKLTSDIDTSSTDYIAADYTESDIVSFDTVTGIKLMNGSDGYFETPRVETTINDVTGETTTKQWTVDDEIEYCYNNAFSGVFDRRILTAKRIKADALWDANYPMSVKNTIADLAILRNDCLCYLDTGMITNLSTSTLEQMISDFSVFNDHKISKNMHHYYVKEPSTKKRVPVTITYFLSKKYLEHAINYGKYIPFVKGYAQLEGHIRDTLYPTIEDYETDLKETLANNRFNYFETVDDNVYQRGTQNTSQTVNSDLLEESNVSTLYEMKRIVEKDINDRMYDFTDADARQRFRTYEVAKFADWSNREVESFDIDFRMNEWESERSILHCFISVVFRGLQKRAILEIDVNKRNVESDSSVTTLVNDDDSYYY